MSQVEDALKQHWPDLPERRWYGFLLCATSYPFGSNEQVAKELKDMAERTDCNPGMAMALADEEMDAAMAEFRERKGNNVV